MRLPSMTRRISTPRRLIVMGKKRLMISSLAFAAGRVTGSGIGSLSDMRMPVSVKSTRSTKVSRAASASTSDCRRSLHAAAAEKSDGSRLSARPIDWTAAAIPVLSLKIWQAEAATVRSISGAGKRQPRPAESAVPLIRLRET